MMEKQNNKQPLSHTVSLPSSNTTLPISSVCRQNSVRNPGKKANAREVDCKSWSFGTVAKAVGSGVTALGTGVVNSSMAVTSGVYEGTKVAGRVTKDVTIAAGKGVYQASEMVGKSAVSGVSAIGSSTVQASKAVTSVSVNAVQDTTKWMKESLLDDCNVHVVLPGQTLEEICLLYEVEPVHVITANLLKSRRLRSGKELAIPSADNMHSLSQLKHDMSNMYIRSACIEDKDETAGILSFSLETISFQSNEKHIVFDVSEIDSIKIEENKHEKIPELLSADEVCGDGGCGGGGKEDDSESVSPQTRAGSNSEIEAGRMAAASLHPRETCDGRNHNPNISIVDVDLNKSGIDREKSYFQILDGRSRMFFSVQSKDCTRIFSHVKLWYPEKLFGNILPSSYHSFDLDEENIAPEITQMSNILNIDIIQQLHNLLPHSVQMCKWNLIYSSMFDGYSLQNFYRMISCHQEPFLLTFCDEVDFTFGSFLTCVPSKTESFAGDGRSWLFDVSHETVTLYPWSRQNDYIFQGKSNCLMIGAHNGSFGIFLDGDLNKGHMAKCETFSGWPREEHDFTIKYFECWNFVS